MSVYLSNNSPENTLLLAYNVLSLWISLVGLEQIIKLVIGVLTGTFDPITSVCSFLIRFMLFFYDSTSL